MAKKVKKVTARKVFTTYHPTYGMNPFWVRSEANLVRSAVHDWGTLKKRGWRVVRCKLVPDFQ